MSISGITTNANVNTSNTTGTSGTSNSAANSFAQQLGPDAFLQLLTTQLSNQDPLDPMDDTQSVTQLAQFSQLQASQNLNSSFTSFSQNFGVLNSSSLIGKSVTVNDPNGDGGTATGTVSSIQVTSGTPNLSLVDSSGNPVTSGGATTFNLSNILSITS